MIEAIAAADITHYEIIFVNDGSPDRSRDLLLGARDKNPAIKLLDLSRNFGHHKAVVAGLAHARGELVFLIDCDLEVSPVELGRFLHAMDQGHPDVVYGVQDKRKGAAIERMGGALFWWLFNHLSQISVPSNVLTERLMTRRYVDALLSLGDRNVFLGGMMYWTGFRQVGITISKTQRAGRSSYSLKRRFSLLVEAVTSFSTVPLKLVLLVGLLITACALLGVIVLVARKLLDPEAILTGYTSLMLAVVGMGGMVLTTLGILGLYVARIFTQTQNRPLYIVRDFYQHSDHD
jgi:putative glycosyltransferase